MKNSTGRDHTDPNALGISSSSAEDYISSVYKAPKRGKQFANCKLACNFA
jgi:hypothetical protein